MEELTLGSKAEDEYYEDFSAEKHLLIRALIIALIVFALIILITGIVLITSKASGCNTSKGGSTQSGSKGGSTQSGTRRSKISDMKEYCAYSKEAELIGLSKFLKKVQKSYFDNYPNQVGFQPDLTREELNFQIQKR